MTLTIHPDTFDRLCEADRRLKFLAAYVKSYGSLTISNERASRTIDQEIDLPMAEYPELLEECTEVRANG